jgi:O-antigen ligase
MERLSKLIVFVSTAAALAVMAMYANRAWSLTIRTDVMAFSASLLLSRLAPRVGLWIVLSSLYWFPALVVWAGLRYEFTSMGLWYSALLGLIAIDSVRSKGWSFSPRYRPALVWWALTLSIAWPILVMRELDFAPALTEHARLWTSRVGVPPPVTIVWILSEALTILVALLWMDWLAGQRRSRTDLERGIGAPLFVGIVITSIVGVVQGLIDPLFLNRTAFGGGGRAAGTLLDGNAFGMLMAMWVPVVIGLALRTMRRRPSISFMTVALAGVMLAALWASGSRTALLAAAVAGVAMLPSLVRVMRSDNRAIVVILLAMFVGLSAAIYFAPAATIGPWQRAKNLVPKLNSESVRRSAFELWDRDHYGGAALRMIADHPIVGVGVGGFNSLVADFAHVNGFGVLPDNAQNWFRQQLAELGLLGSAGWIWWGAAFAVALCIPRSAARDDLQDGVRAGLVGMSIGSLLGMPAQNPAVALTFVTMAAAWIHHDAPSESRVKIIPGQIWWLILSAVAAFGAGTYVEARGELRPARRAVRGEWNYEIGVVSEIGPDGRTYSRTQGHSVQVRRAVAGQYLRFTFRVPDAPVADEFVRVRLWRKDQLIANVEIGDSRPVTYYIRVLPPEMMIMIESDARGVLPGSGLLISPWEYVDQPPPGAVVIP